MVFGIKFKWFRARMTLNQEVKVISTDPGTYKMNSEFYSNGSSFSKDIATKPNQDFYQHYSTIEDPQDYEIMSNFPVNILPESQENNIDSEKVTAPKVEIAMDSMVPNHVYEDNEPTTQLNSFETEDIFNNNPAVNEKVGTWLTKIENATPNDSDNEESVDSTDDYEKPIPAMAKKPNQFEDNSSVAANLFLRCQNMKIPA